MDITQSEIAGSLDLGKLDLVLVGASWDPRSLAPISLLRPGFATILLCYSNPGVSGRSAAHRQALSEWIQDGHVKPEEMKFSSENVVESFSLIWTRVTECAKEHRRPLRMAIDLSVVPRYLSLGLLARGFLDNVVRDAYFIYESAIYPIREPAIVKDVSVSPLGEAAPAVKPDAEDGLLESPSTFTEGRWRTVYVPGLRGSYRPGRKRHYVIGLGFEGDDTYRVIQQQEPDVVTAIVPDPPIYEGLAERCLKENEVLIKEWVGPDRLLRCGAADAVGIDQLLATIPQLDENMCFLPVGTKPHGLGMAVRSLRSGSPMVLYRWPERHAEGGAERGERRYLYHVRDRAAI